MLVMLNKIGMVFANSIFLINIIKLFSGTFISAFLIFYLDAVCNRHLWQMPLSVHDIEAISLLKDFISSMQKLISQHQCMLSLLG